MIIQILGTFLPWIIVGIGCWIGMQLIRQNGRILLRLETLEQQLTQRNTVPEWRTGAQPAPRQPQGLPVGSVASPFTLPDLSRTLHSLAQWQGQRLLLLFFNPNCGFCQQMVAVRLISRSAARVKSAVGLTPFVRMGSVSMSARKGVKPVAMSAVQRMRSVRMRSVSSVRRTRYPAIENVANPGPSAKRKGCVSSVR